MRGDVLKGAVAAIVKQPASGSAIRLGCAIRFAFAVEAAENIVLRRTTSRRSRHEQIEQAVAVVIEPQSGRAQAVALAQTAGVGREISSRLHSRPSAISRRTSSSICARSPSEIGSGILEVVVEAVLDRLPDRDLHARIEAPDGLREGGAPTSDEDEEGVVPVARREDLDRLAVGERQAEILHAAVGSDHHRLLLGQLRPDRAGSVETGRAVGQLQPRIVRENDMHGRAG